MARLAASDSAALRSSETSRGRNTRLVATATQRRDLLLRADRPGPRHAGLRLKSIRSASSTKPSRQILVAHPVIGELGGAADDRPFRSVEADRAVRRDPHGEDHRRSRPVGQQGWRRLRPGSADKAPALPSGRYKVVPRRQASASITPPSSTNQATSAMA